MVKGKTASKSAIPSQFHIEGNSGNDTIDITARIENTPACRSGDDRFSLTGTVTTSTLVGGIGADLLTFSNVVGNTSVKAFGSAEDTDNDTVVFTSSATDINVDFAEGADSLSLAKGATNATVAAAAGNDTVIAALTFANSSIEAAAGDDSLSISVLSGSTISGGSGGDTVNLSKAVSSEVYQIRPAT